MRPEIPYTPYHPRWHRPRMSVWWWLRKPVYTLFVLRELTSVFVALFAAVSLWQLSAIARGPEAYAGVQARLATPAFLVLHAVAFLFVLFHAVTWVHLAPRALVVRWRGRRVPDAVVVGVAYAVWLLLSGAVARLLLGARG